MRGGGGAKAVWNFPKNSSDLVAGSCPKVMLPRLLRGLGSAEMTLMSLSASL